MKHGQVTIAIHDRCIRALADGRELGVLDSPSPAADLRELSSVIPRVFDGGGIPQSAVVVIPASWCYVQRFAVAARRPTEAMLRFAFEEFLPVDIESLSCDFVRVGPGEFIGIGLPLQRGRALLDVLAELGVQVERLSVDALELAAWPDTGTFVWCDQAHIAYGRTLDGSLVDLRVVRFAAAIAGEEWLQRAAAQLPDETAGAPVIDGPWSDDDLAPIAESLDGIIRRSEKRRLAPVSGFDLARGALAPAGRALANLRAWRTTLASALVVGILLCAGVLMQRAQVARQLHEVQRWEQGVFREFYPAATLPAGIATRLASERRRLEALTRTPAGENPKSDAVSALSGVVLALPDSIRLDLQELRIEGNDVFLRGRTREPADAERVAQSLDRLDWLDCSPTRTDRQRDGVAFTVQAKRTPGGTP